MSPEVLICLHFSLGHISVLVLVAPPVIIGEIVIWVRTSRTCDFGENVSHHAGDG